MASLTVRQLDEKVKKLLRLRAARHGRSMEDEIRTILGQAARAGRRKRPSARGAAMHRSPPSPAVQRQPAQPTTRRAPGRGRVLLIIGGGIAAYKSLDLIRRLQDHGATVRCILTKAAQEFVTPLAAGALAGGAVFTDLFDPKSEFDVGHIRLARDTDLVVVAPATADLMAKMAGGHADDLASAVLLATDKPILIAPAMNPMMWAHKATQRNLAQLIDDGVATVGPNAGEMAERGEAGTGRMAEPTEIAAAAVALLDGDTGERPLAGKRVVITSGPTHEPIDPVRYIANRSSGKQGHAIAAAAAAAGAEVVLVSGPVNVPDPRRRQNHQGRIGAADARRGREGAAGGLRDLRGRGRGLARRRRQIGKDQEDQRRNAGAVAGREPRHPRDGRAPQVEAAAARHRLRRRDRESCPQRQGQAQAQRLRLDHRQ